ncbi:hypothetical protein ACFLIM_12710 [Nonomuraea sp. M3C6]|uniref:DUF5709 domain-containing protein n=1 Tax=Nonomuraea marmarensis TaxID=3351344 RepID=A0ABW7ACK1_9ACTN
MDIRGDDNSYDEEEEELSIETPEADAAEQHREMLLNSGEPRRELPLDVDPGDAAEQDRVVEMDDEDYR